MRNMASNLSFHAAGTFVRRDILAIPREADGRLWRHVSHNPSVSRHVHDEIEMNIAIRGEAAYLVGQTRYRLTAGTMIWLFPGHDHLLIDQSPDFCMWILVARPCVVEYAATVSAKYSTLTRFDPAGSFARVITPEQREPLLVLFEQVSAQSDDIVCYNSGIRYATAASWRAYSQAHEGSQSSGLHPAVERAVRILREEEEATTIGTLARLSGISPSRLSRLFHRQVGMPIVVFRNSQRLDRFHRLRDHQPGMNLAQAALEAGFGSYAQFYRVYKAANGCGPSDR